MAQKDFGFELIQKSELKDEELEKIDDETTTLPQEIMEESDKEIDYSYRIYKHRRKYIYKKRNRTLNGKKELIQFLQFIIGIVLCICMLLVCLLFEKKNQKQG